MRVINNKKVSIQRRMYGRWRAKKNSLSKYLLSHNSVLYARLVCLVNRGSAWAPNLGTKSASARSCVKGMMSPNGAPLARTARLRTNMEVAGSGNGPAREENLGLSCDTTSNRCTYARKRFEMGWVSPFGGTTRRMRRNWATQWPVQAQYNQYVTSS